MSLEPIPLKPYLAKRIAATLIDYVIFSLISGVYIWAFNENPDPGSIQVTGLAVLPICIMWFLYFPLTEGLSGATPGHDFMKLKIVFSNGRQISFSTALKRRLCDTIDLSTYGIIALILILKTSKHQRLGDLLADTIVIKKADYRTSPKPVF